MKTAFSTTLLLLFLTTGCVDDPTTSDSVPEPMKASPAVADSSAGSESVTFLDSDALQEGCGEVDADVSKEFQTTDSGLRYRILRKSDKQKPDASHKVTVDYRGWLDNGKEFDSSYKSGEAISFPLNGVIPGWTEGMQLIGLGGMIELWIPPDLGYGPDGAGDAVPPNATLHFVVELLEIQ